MVNVGDMTVGQARQIALSICYATKWVGKGDSI